MFQSALSPPAPRIHVQTVTPRKNCSVSEGNPNALPVDKSQRRQSLSWSRKHSEERKANKGARKGGPVTGPGWHGDGAETGEHISTACPGGRRKF